MKSEMVSIGGIELELHEAGSGTPLLLLHSAQGFNPAHSYVGLLAKRRRVIAPSHPGFGKSSLPDWLDAVDDIAHLYLELMDRLDLGRVDLLGSSIGGWIAAEIATKVPDRVKHLVLAAPIGVKFGTPDRLEFPDIYAMPQERVMKLLYHDPENAKIDYAALSDEEITTVARNRETTALLTWEPFMHNPKLKHRLHRLTMPTLLLRGASDGFVSAAHIESYAKRLAQARVTTIAAAGHAIHVEQPQAFADTILSFLDP